MHNFLSPQHASSHKIDFLNRQRSPSFRTKRVPSVQENICSSQNFKPSKIQSPCKSTQEMRRKKSQVFDANSNSAQKRRGRQNNQTKEIIMEIQDLKDQYRTLKDSYKLLLQEKLKHTEELRIVKDQNEILKQKIEQNSRLQQQVQQLKSELKQQRQKVKQYQRELQIQKFRDSFKAQQKKQIFIKEKAQNQKHHALRCQDGSIIRSIYNDSHLLSFTLTSVIEESIMHQENSSKKPENNKIDLETTQEKDSQKVQPKLKKEPSSTFNKRKKDINRLQPSSQAKQTKSSSLMPIFNQLFTVKSPTAAEKKIIKTNSVTKRRRLQDKQNFQARTAKKKNKKLLQLGVD